MIPVLILDGKKGEFGAFVSTPFWADPHLLMQQSASKPARWNEK
jgi:hypothetical protein